MKPFSMNCPEVNGAFAAIEEMVEDGDMEPKEGEASLEKWLEEHTKECPYCAREAKAATLPA